MRRPWNSASPSLRRRQSRFSHQLRRQHLAAGQFRAGADDDGAGIDFVLRRIGAGKERARHHDAQLILMAVVSALWMFFGYSLAFGEGNAFFGSPSQYFMFKDVGGAPNADYAATIPHTSFMLFQMMFAIITPALISGAVAERIKFSSYLLFTVLWVTIVYFPLCHMVWGKGGLFNWALGGKIPVLDFAGGTVVHVSSGVAALVAAL
jgi:ammonia channel protein AmtB